MPEDFFTTEYLFASSAPANQKLFLIGVGVFVLLVIISVLLNFNQKIHKALKNRLFNFFLTTGILGLIFAFFRYESIPYLGARVVLLALIIAAVIWYFVITAYAVFRMPSELRAIKNHERYVQYLPRKKKRIKN